MLTRVLLYSSGLDSYIASRLLGPAYRPVYVDIGSRYGGKEAWWISQHHPQTEILRSAIYLGNLEREDGFVPQRNTLLITLVQAQYDADEVVLCGVRGEYSRDKHPRFYRDTSQLLSYTAGKPVKVWSPFRRLTKSQAVKLYLDRGYPPADLINDTVSCYDASSFACGRCMSCFRRWVALENNGLAQEQAWGSPPWSSTSFSSPSTLRRLPVRQWLDFARAQRDVATAYYRLHRRQHAS